MRRFTWLLLVGAAVAACSGTTDDSTTATHPEVYAQAFRDPCCSGTPDGMLFTPESIAAQGAVVDEWAAGPQGIAPVFGRLPPPMQW